eukprot:m.21827 g.21827  ORF g.21827 m.21827 type:complete len:358 (-) comp8336_c0_seq2:2147-3220(-)
MDRQSSNAWGHSLRHGPKLKMLNMPSKNLCFVPEEIAACTQLTKLVLCRNKLTSLPLSFSSLTALTQLNLSNNLFSTAPACLSRLANLKVLQMHRCQVRSIELVEEAPFPMLEILNLSENQIIELPAAIGSLPRLTTLSMDANNLSALPIFTAICPLERLSAMGNSITTLDPSLTTLQHLKELILVDNQLTDVPIFILQCPALVTFDISLNFLRSVDSRIVVQKKIKHFYAEGNPFREKAYDTDGEQGQSMTLVEFASRALLNTNVDPRTFRTGDELTTAFNEFVATLPPELQSLVVDAGVCRTCSKWFIRCYVEAIEYCLPPARFKCDTREGGGIPIRFRVCSSKCFRDGQNWAPR